MIGLTRKNNSLRRGSARVANKSVVNENNGIILLAPFKPI